MSFSDSSNNLNIERHLARSEAQLELLSSKVESINSQIEKNDSTTDNVKVEMAVLKDQITQVSNTLQELKDKTEKLNNNVFLQFTSEITSQKLITIIVILSTAVSSPTLITSWINGSLPDPETQRIEQLIDLLQKNTNN